MEFLKKYWKKIVTIIFVILFFSTCASNCSHKNEIRNMKNQYAMSDSLIASGNDKVRELRDSIKDLNSSVSGLEKENELYIKQINDLNNALSRKVVVNVKSNN